MKTLALVALLLLAACVAAGAEEAATVAAQQAAARGDYQLAVRDYQLALQRDGFSVPVLFNLGNAWLRLGKPARAILEYERARALAPHSAAIAANLATARQRAGLATETAGPWLAAARYLSFDAYAWAGLAAMWVLCVSLVMLSLNRSARRIAWPLILAAAVAMCLSADALALCWSDQYRAVVQLPATMHLAPADSAAASGSLREGEVVWLQDHYGHFDFVRSAQGRSGWIDEHTAVPVRVPRP